MPVVNRSALAGVLWAVGGSALTAVATLLGVRILTQLVPPAVFGTVTLGTGGVALALALLCSPLSQAAMHFFPLLASVGRVDTLREALALGFRQVLMWAAPGLIVVVIGAQIFIHAGALTVLLALLLMADGWRTVQVSLLNSAGRQASYALWVTLDAWARPAMAAVAVATLGATPEVVIGAFVLGSAMIALACSGRIKDPQSATSTPDGDARVCRANELELRMWRYARPLMPLAIVGWLLSMGDRYVIGGVLTVAEVGVYAAIYGAASAPFMMVGGTLELALRPVHQAAVSTNEPSAARRIFLTWLLMVIAAGITGVTVLVLWHDAIAGVLVARDYRVAAQLMPWIGAGYALRATSYVLERLCYAYGLTSRVLLIQLAAGAAALVVTPVAVIHWGLKGAALAVPVGYAIQLLVAAIAARPMWIGRLQRMHDTGALRSPVLETATSRH